MEHTIRRTKKGRSTGEVDSAAKELFGDARWEEVKRSDTNVLLAHQLNKMIGLQRDSIAQTESLRRQMELSGSYFRTMSSHLQETTFSEQVRAYEESERKRIEASVTESWTWGALHNAMTLFASFLAATAAFSFRDILYSMTAYNNSSVENRVLIVFTIVLAGIMFSIVGQQTEKTLKNRLTLKQGEKLSNEVKNMIDEKKRRHTLLDQHEGGSVREDHYATYARRDMQFDQEANDEGGVEMTTLLRKEVENRTRRRGRDYR